MNAKTAVMFVMLMQIAPTPSAPTIAPVIGYIGNGPSCLGTWERPLASCKATFDKRQMNDSTP